MNDTLWWYLARSGGVVAWALLFASVGWGLTLSATVISRPRGAWFLDLHRFLGGLAIVFVAIHVTGLMMDRYVPFGVRQVLVPFASRWRPEAVAWGIVSLYLLLAVELSSLVMKRLPWWLWKGIHWTSFGMLVGATVHVFLAGTDAHLPGFAWVSVAGGSGLGLLLLVRIGAPPGSPAWYRLRRALRPNAKPEAGR
ncbi:MAG: hypothetical protein ACYDGR_03520 [Candidatus Dormibacteria bacterium]